MWGVSLFLGSLLLNCVPLSAQGLRVDKVTPNYIEYVVRNDSLDTGSPVDFVIPYDKGADSFQILGQSVVPIPVGKVANPSLYKDNGNTEVSPLVQITRTGISQKQRVANLHINISRYRSSDRMVLITKYLRIRVERPGTQPLISERAPGMSENMTQQNESSPLTSGTWYKIPFHRNGIYRIDKQYLTNLGINVSNIDPRNIQLWGTNGYELPHPNADSRPSFAQIPIIVSGESDGSFDDSDYILFYGNSPNQNIYDTNTKSWHHKLHPYSTQNYVFLTVGSNAGERLHSVTAQGSGQTITTFRDFLWKEDELHKSEPDIKSGTQWLGQQFTNESFNNQQTIFADTLAGLPANGSLQVLMQFAAKSQSTSFFNITANNVNLGQVSIPPISDYNGDTGYSAYESSISRSITSISYANGIIKVSAAFNSGSSSANGWIDWIELSIPRTLQAKDGRLLFYSPNDGQTNDVGTYQLSGFSNKPIVMDVTDPVNPDLLTVQGSGNNYSIPWYANGGHMLIAQTNFYTPETGTTVPNQDLHGITDYPNYIIVTAPDFLAEANDIANFHKKNDGFRPLVVTQEQIFNEFSGGVPDVSAIRDFMRYLYVRAGTNANRLPKYLLLFGNTTYDYKGIEKSVPEKNYVFTYESNESLQRINTFASDDYYGLLDQYEGEWAQNDNSELLDVGVGRITVDNEQDAKAAVKKIETYSNPANNGDWKTLFTFAADDDFPHPLDNRDLHVLNADSTSVIVTNSDNGLHLKKIYEFSYPVENTTAGRRIPEATQAFINSVNNGELVINYSGHGGNQVLSDERLFVSDYTSQFYNKNQLAIFVTATCSFGRYDDTDLQSGAEITQLYPDGGMIASFSTTRVVYTSDNPYTLNFGINRIITQYMSTRDEVTGQPRRLGDIYRLTKITGIAGPSFNSRKFILLGDPGLKIGLPNKNIQLDKVNNVAQLSDTTINLRALDKVHIEGDVLNYDQSVASDFNGTVFVQVYDANRSVKLPNRDWMQYGCYLKNCSYNVRTDILFSGRATVTGGHFKADFILPKDISYSGRRGRMTFYATSGTVDASGEYNRFTLSGTNPNAVNDNSGPAITMYLNDKSFLNGNLVNQSPDLVVNLNDPSGINTTGNGVGHELIAQLTSPNKPNQTIVLNDFYTSNLDNFTSGKIQYRFNSLPEGDYHLNLRAWDVYNNPSQSSISFKVANSDHLTVRRVYNFPNPMNNETRFIIEHNQPGIPLDIHIRIYTLSGRPVAHIDRDGIVSNAPYASIEWSGRDDDNDRLATGTYLYSVKVKAQTDSGTQTQDRIDKLVIIH